MLTSAYKRVRMTLAARKCVLHIENTQNGGIDMNKKYWLILSKVAKFVKYNVNKKLGIRLQDAVDDLYDRI